MRIGFIEKYDIYLHFYCRKLWVSYIPMFISFRLHKENLHVGVLCICTTLREKRHWVKFFSHLNKFQLILILLLIRSLGLKLKKG